MLCETEFKTRWYNHTQSFRKKQLSNATDMAKYIWLCKDRGSIPETKWEILRNATSYTIEPKHVSYDWRKNLKS